MIDLNALNQAAARGELVTVIAPPLPLSGDDDVVVDFVCISVRDALDAFDRFAFYLDRPWSPDPPVVVRWRGAR